MRALYEMTADTVFEGLALTGAVESLVFAGTRVAVLVLLWCSWCTSRPGLERPSAKLWLSFWKWRLAARSTLALPKGWAATKCRALVSEWWPARRGATIREGRAAW